MPHDANDAALLRRVYLLTGWMWISLLEMYINIYFIVDLLALVRTERLEKLSLRNWKDKIPEN